MKHNTNVKFARKEDHNKLVLRVEFYNSSVFKTCQVVQETIDINCFLHNRLLATPIALPRQAQWALNCLNYTWFHTPLHQVPLNISTVLVNFILRQGLQVLQRLRTISSIISL